MARSASHPESKNKVQVAGKSDMGRTLRPFDFSMVKCSVLTSPLRRLTDIFYCFLADFTGPVLGRWFTRVPARFLLARISAAR